MDDWLMDLMDMLLMNYWLMEFVNNRLMCFLNNIFMCLINNIFMMLMDDILVLFLNYSGLLVHFNNWFGNMLYNFSLSKFFSYFCGLDMFHDHWFVLECLDNWSMSFLFACARVINLTTGLASQSFCSL